MIPYFCLTTILFTETQVLLPMLQSDLYEVMISCVKGNLEMHTPVFHKSKHCVAVVLASGGYPGSYKKGMTIDGLEQAKVSKVPYLGHNLLGFQNLLLHENCRLLH